MPDWTASMQQTFEYYTVDPGTWKDVKQLKNILSCSIERDSESATLGSATIDATESIGECYVRVYLITIQNGIREKHPLGTFLVQTPSTSFDGVVSNVSMDAYTPLLELKENPPELGYSILKGENIMEHAYRLTREHARAPVVKTESDKIIHGDFIANTDDTWINFISDLIANAKYQFALDEMSRILFAPEQDTASLQPVWTYNDDNSSILYPDLTLKHDIYGIPNVVEVVYSPGYYDPDDGTTKTIYTVINDDSNSPISTVNRGRKLLRREVNPSSLGDTNTVIPKSLIEEYATGLLKELSTLEYTLTYKHGYCPVRLGDCVRLNYKKIGLKNIKAKVISQSISCTPGCSVSETAVFTTKLWR